MSEDCHDSNNESAFRLPYDPTVPCTECGKPVYADDVYPVDIEHDDTSEVAVFHNGTMCVLNWSLKRLEVANEKMQNILAVLDQIHREIKGNS